METRVPNRLAGYDYSQQGVYFLTVCTKDKSPIFWNLSLIDTAVGATCGRPPLSLTGKLVEQELQRLEAIYPCVCLHKATIMPDHIHLLIELLDGRPQVAPTVSRIMQQFKGKISKLAGRPIWQKSYYDHVIRDENDFLTKWNYMENNPAKWLECNRP
ncbi:MAG: transposase [Oscillibacter sp.]|nr:transposase [Oscillibacter sp.]